MSDTVCRHCGSPLYGQGEFCCSGCEAAWRMIHNLGLEDFYSRKAGVITSKVAEQPFILEEHFADCVTSSGDLNTAVFYITSVRCAACVWLVENVVKKIPGVQDVRVNYATFRTKLVYKLSEVSLKYILEQIAAVGNPPVPNNPVNNDSERRELFLRFGIGAFFTVQLMIYSIALYAGYFTDMPPSFKRVMQFISWALATPVLLYTGAPFFKNSIKALKQRHTSMDVLVALGAGSAYLYSIAAIFLGYEVYFDTCATILTLITLGRYIELTSKQRSRGNMLSLFSLAPPFARLLADDGTETLVPLANVKEGDRLRVLPGDKVPVDGTVISGSSELNESMLSGEPIPKSKQSGDAVFAGTLNGAGALLISANAVKNTVLAQIIDAIESADVSKTRLIKLVDRVVSVFVPAVILLALLTFLLRIFVYDNALAQALMHSVAVLVVACPCALGLAVPLVVTTAIGNAASFGAIIKNGDLLGTLQEVDRICFDKTGTLTVGRPEIIKYNATDERFLIYSTTIESYSAHILAQTIARYATERVQATDINEEAGNGVSGLIDGHCVRVGRYDFVTDKAADKDAGSLYEEMQRDLADGGSVVCVSIDGDFVGYYVLSDPLRADSAPVLRDLSRKYAISLLSGDTPVVVANIAGELGVDYQAALSPFDKVSILKKHQEAGEKVLMVGDGINDAPALKQSDASIAVGKNAADIAIDSADAVLIRQDITLITHLFSLSYRTKRIIKENLCWSFIYNIIAIPLAAAGVIHPVASAVFMSISSVIVVLNSTRARVEV